MNVQKVFRLWKIITHGSTVLKYKCINCKDLARDLKLNHMILRSYLNLFEDMGLISIRKEKHRIYIRKDFMRLDPTLK